MAAYYPSELPEDSLLLSTGLLSNVSYLIKVTMGSVKEMQPCLDHCQLCELPVP